jgi:hypothetical protein
MRGVANTPLATGSRQTGIASRSADCRYAWPSAVLFVAASALAAGATFLALCSAAGRGSLERTLAEGVLPMQLEQDDSSDGWYYAAYDGQVGPLTLEQVRKLLTKFPEPERVLVWRKGFSDWARAGDVAEFSMQTSRPPPPPTDEMPTWRVKWWWYPIPFIAIKRGQSGRAEGDDLEFDAAAEGESSEAGREPGTGRT